MQHVPEKISTQKEINFYILIIKIDYYNDSKAWRKSLLISSIFSIPIEQRIIFSGIPRADHSSILQINTYLNFEMINAYGHRVMRPT